MTVCSAWSRHRFPFFKTIKTLLTQQTRLTLPVSLLNVKRSSMSSFVDVADDCVTEWTKPSLCVTGPQHRVAAGAALWLRSKAQRRANRATRVTSVQLNGEERRVVPRPVGPRVSHRARINVLPNFNTHRSKRKGLL